MFDKLIESEPEGADFKNRRSYFMVSALVVGVFFASAVVISIYAADIGLGNSSFELVEMIAPPELTPPEPERPEPQQPQAQTQTEKQVAQRQAAIARMDEVPPAAPTTVSTTQNTQRERPKSGYVEYGSKFDVDPVGVSTSGRNTSGGASGGLSTTTPQTVAVVETEIPPPPVRRDPPPVKTPPVQSLGVINGRASHLPKPVYTAAAIAVHAAGKVDVQVMIDETGKVISASAVSGHPLLRAPAEQAARNARFTPTLLSKVPVKVTGVITYNFTR